MNCKESKSAPYRLQDEVLRWNPGGRLASVVLLSLFGLGSFISSSTYAQGFNNGSPIRVISPTAAGGATDSVIRSMLPKMSTTLGMPLVVENLPGAGGIVGTGAIARALPDGHTIGIATSGALAANPFLKKKLPYDDVKDFAPICRVGRGPYILAVASTLGVKTLAELLARAKLESLTFASPGVGSSAHMAQELFKARTGAKFLHVPYKGTGQAITDTVGGQTQALFEAPGPLMPHIRSGKLIPLGVTSAQRVSSLPDVPTFKELGYKDTVLEGWIGFMAPAATPANVVDRISKACESSLQAPDLKAHAQALGFEVDYAGPVEFQNFIASEKKLWGEVVKLSGLQAE